jgi:hypothetical protein
MADMEMPNGSSDVGAGSNTKHGLGGVVLRSGMFLAGQRAGQVQNTLFSGAFKTAGNTGFWGGAKTNFQGFFLNYRATDQEMSTWRSGGGFMRRGWNASVGKIPGLGMSTESWLMTGSAPSLWMASSQMMGKGAGTRDAWRLLHRRGYYDVTDRFKPGVKGSGVDGLFNNAQRVDEWEQSVLAGSKNAGGKSFNYAASMSADEAMDWSVQALKFHNGKMRLPKMPKGWTKNLEKYGYYAGQPLKHYAAGAFYKVGHTSDEILGMARVAKTAKEAKVLERVARIVGEEAGGMAGVRNSGRALSMLSEAGLLGSKGGQVALGMTKLGSTLLPALGLATRLMPYVAIAQTAYDVGKAAWKVGDLYFSKMPRHFYRSMNDQMVRAPFASIAAGMPDSPASVNNRARAVQAIQMSRMNARSTIGREASMMAQHFG